jgi:hypothetical protein
VQDAIGHASIRNIVIDGNGSAADRMRTRGRCLRDDACSCGRERPTASMGEGVMTASNWGLCKECQWWQIEPEANIADATMGLCIEERLQPFRLRVSGNSGCNRHATGQPARAAGSGAAPPTAEPQR